MEFSSHTEIETHTYNENSDELPFEIAGTQIYPGERKTILLPAATLYTQTPLNIPVHVIRGKKPGPRLFIVATIHGNEINGMEIIRRLLKSSRLKKVSGTLIAVPIVNIYGFINQSRYLPDRRDLNRSFPGTKTGSLASRLAYILMNEVIKKCTHGIDLHTGAIHRTNLPQLRINLDMPGVRQLAESFNVPVIINANLRDGSLRQACNELAIPILVYEAGEALRLDEVAIRIGIHGALGVMEKLKMITPLKTHSVKTIKSTLARSNTWIRSTGSGVLQPLKKLGDVVKKKDVLGVITNPFGEEQIVITAPAKGIVIGKTNLPLVNTGDALFHLAYYTKIKHIASQVDELQYVRIED